MKKHHGLPVAIPYSPLGLQFSMGCCLAILALVPALAGQAAITVDGLADKARYDDTVTFTIVAEAGFDTDATLDGLPVNADAPITVDRVQYHELAVQKQPTGGGAVESLLVRFIVRNSERISTEDGLPTFTPPPTVHDASSAFAGATLALVAPTEYPRDLLVPVVGFLRNAASEPLWLNGTVQSSQFPSAPLELRRGWGSLLLPAFTKAGAHTYDGQLASLNVNAQLQIESNTTWTTKGGALGSEDWGTNARIHITSNLTVQSGATLNIGAGSVIKLAPGAEILVAGGVLNLGGSLAQPVVFTSEAPTEPWGGILLGSTAGSRLTATGVIFTGSGADSTWFNTHSGYSYHRREQACLLVDSGAQAFLTNCFFIRLAGQAFNMKSGALSLTDCLVQNATTGGQLNGGVFNALRCGFLEFPDTTSNFVDGDNDGLYLVPGSGNLYTLERCVIAFTKDDGMDSGAGRILVRRCWIENCFHEGFSPSVSGHNSENYDTVFIHCGQGLEQGFGSTETRADHCLFLGCMVGLRSGDNYGAPTFTDYSGHLTATNCLSLHNTFHDVWGYEWNSWTYRTDRMTIESNYLTAAASPHPNNTVWDPIGHGALLDDFMPVPGGNVGVAVTGVPRQLSLADYPEVFDVRLSSFSSKPVSVQYSLVGKTDPLAAAETIVASGTVEFTAGETWKALYLPLPTNHTFGLARLALSQPQNAELTGDELLFFATPPRLPDAVLIPSGASNWMYQALRSEPAGNWRGLNYVETNWVQGRTAPIGFGNIGASGAYITLNTVLTTAEQGSSSDRTRTVYFRRHFQVDDPAEVRSLSLRLMRDDGAVVYLNGKEVGRNNMDSGTTVGGVISYSTLATDTLDLAAESAFVSMPVATDLVGQLRAGDNVIVVEVHQVSTTSSDLVLDLELVASFHPPLSGVTGLARDASGALSLYWLDNRWQLQESKDLANWTTLTNAASLWPVSDNAPHKFYRWTRPE